MSRLSRQVALYGAFGLVQIVVDWLMFVGLTMLAVHVVEANLAGRVCGACVGYWANGRWTFRDVHGGHRLGGGSLVRFLALWCATAITSTVLVRHVDLIFGLGGAWVGKPMIDLGLAILAFVVSRRWVFR